MNKKKAFSLIEVIVSMSILFLVLIPSIKLNIQQIKNYSKIMTADRELHFFTSLNDYLKLKTFSNTHLEFNNYSNFLMTFTTFENIFQELENKNFKLIIDVENVEINFSDRKQKAQIVSLEYRGEKKIYKNKLLKFEE